jgi:hypothetical protein
VKGRDPKFIWEIVGIYRALNEDMRAIERLAAQTDYSGNSTKCSIIGGDLNLPYADWNGNAECTSGVQAFINRLVWENRRHPLSYKGGHASNRKIGSPNRLFRKFYKV